MTQVIGYLAPTREIRSPRPQNGPALADMAFWGVIWQMKDFLAFQTNKMIFKNTERHLWAFLNKRDQCVTKQVSLPLAMPADSIP